MFLFLVFTAVQNTPVFQYLFIIFSTFQGFFLFLFYCVLKRDAQLAWMKTCPCFEYEGGYTSTSSNKLVNGKSRENRFRSELSPLETLYCSE